MFKLPKFFTKKKRSTGGQASDDEKNDKHKNKFVPTSGFHNDIVFYKFLNTDKYELDTAHIQVWVFDKNRKCIHASDNEFDASFYIGKSMDNINLQEDVYSIFKDIHVMSLNGIESKRTVMFNDRLAYVEGRALFYNEDVNDIYATMLIFIPYQNVSVVRSSAEKRIASMDVAQAKPKEKPVLKRSNSDSNLKVKPTFEKVLPHADLTEKRP